jgi:hypothetical protein
MAKRHLKIAFVKWGFTWVLAFIPILFLFFKQYLQKGDLNWGTMCSTGEFFLVSIVMVSEPLGDLVLSTVMREACMVLVMCTIFLIVTNTYIFSLNETRTEELQINRLKDDHHPKKNDVAGYVKYSGLPFEIQRVPIDSLLSMPTPVNKAEAEAASYLERLQLASIACFLCSIVLGALSVLLGNFYPPTQQHEPARAR